MAVAVLLLPRYGFSQEGTEANVPVKTAQAWTLDDALAQLALQPRDGYLQYVALQLAREEDRAREVNRMIKRVVRRGTRSGRRRRVDLFSLFTGALAIQESLQLDLMRGQDPGDLGGAREETVEFADLQGPAVESHPWEKMLSGRKPAISPLAYCVPEDSYFIVFGSMNKMLEAMEVSDLWGTHLSSQTLRRAFSREVGRSYRAQLAIETNRLMRPIYDMIVKEVAVTGRDLFLREGSDLTLLFLLKQPELFKARMDGFLAKAERSRGDAKRSAGEYQGVPYVHLATPDRAVSVYSAYPRPDLHVRSNSMVAFARVIETILGKDDQGQPVSRLGDTDEYAYIRTLMPRNPDHEDGFIYLSDAFIRRLAGPRLKITERRRMLCYNHLRMIAHAAVMYQTQFGRRAKSPAELAEAGTAPGLFGEAPFVCPDGGIYYLAAGGPLATCSAHGHVEFLTPSSEIPIKAATSYEARLYKDFVNEYNRYWRTYFDPIAIRVQVTPERYRLETIILPLIDNSIYTSLASFLGGQPEPLDALPVPERNVFTIAVKIQKQQLDRTNAVRSMEFMLSRMLRELSSPGMPEEKMPKPNIRRFLTEGIGNQIAMHTYDAQPMVDFNLPEFLGQLFAEFGTMGTPDTQMIPVTFMITSLAAPTYISAPVRDADIVDNFLEQLDRLFAMMARQPPEEVFLFTFDKDFFTLRPREGQVVRCVALKFGPVKWRIFWARIGGGLYVASKRFILEDIIEREAQRDVPAKAAAETGPVAHAMVRVRADHWHEVLKDYRLGWAENNREACLNNLGSLSNAARACAAMAPERTRDKRQSAALTPEIQDLAERLYGVRFFCPEGGRYLLAPDGHTAHCSLHGSVLAPRQPMAPPPDADLGRLLDSFTEMTATLTFQEEGLHAAVTIDRK